MRPFLLESKTFPELSRFKEQSPGSGCRCCPSLGECDPLASKLLSPHLLFLAFPPGLRKQVRPGVTELLGGGVWVGWAKPLLWSGGLVESGGSGPGPAKRTCCPFLEDLGF